MNQLTETTAKPDLMSQLNQQVPSFNYNKQSGGDGSDAIDFASLRGLGFDQTLVLVNGKRRHQSAFVNEVVHAVEVTAVPIKRNTRGRHRSCRNIT